MIRVTLATPIIDIPPQAIAVNDVAGKQAIYFADADEAVALALGGEVFRARDRDPEPAPLPPPAPPPPRRGVAANGSLRRALIRRRVDPDSVTAILQTITDATEQREALTLWEYEPYLRRDMALVEFVRAANGWSAEQADALFAEAAAEDE